MDELLRWVFTGGLGAGALAAIARALVRLNTAEMPYRDTITWQSEEIERLRARNAELEAENEALRRGDDG